MVNEICGVLFPLQTKLKRERFERYNLLVEVNQLFLVFAYNNSFGAQLFTKWSFRIHYTHLSIVYPGYYSIQIQIITWMAREAVKISTGVPSVCLFCYENYYVSFPFLSSKQDYNLDLSDVFFFFWPLVLTGYH